MNTYDVRVMNRKGKIVTMTIDAYSLLDASNKCREAGLTVLRCGKSIKTSSVDEKNNLDTGTSVMLLVVGLLFFSYLFIFKDYSDKNNTKVNVAPIVSDTADVANAKLDRASIPVTPKASTTINHNVDVVTAAMLMCKGLEDVNATECDISYFKETIDATFYTSGSEARIMCTGFVNAIAAHTRVLRSNGWKLRIFSPYSGDRPIAVCNF